jgi:PAS domain S-box-containing protein
MAERTRAFDWSKTPVGPMAEWPQGLKTVVRVMLDSRYAMWLGWGPDFTFFYNDAYAAMTLGPKHPWALGRSAREVWSEIWADIGPRAESVLRTGKATWDEGLLLFLQRRGFPEETYHTFSYSPVPGDQGGVGGMLCVVTEDTQRAIGERRLRTLRELAARTTDEARCAEDACQSAARTLAGNPNDIPFALLYLLDAEGRRATLASSTGLEQNGPASPAVLDLDKPETPWPFHKVAETGKAIEVGNLPDKFGPLPGGAWPESPHRAIVLPMAKPGQSRLAGFVVAGISPRLVFDDDYKGFLDLLAGHVGTAIANARAYEEEKRRAEALAELDRAKTAFFSNVSHEFRTPLTLMLGPVEDLLAKSHTDLSPAAAGQLEVVSRNGLRLLRLVNTLLDFSRIEAGRVRATFQPTDLGTFTADLASVFRAACERAGLRLVVSCTRLDEPVYVDREMWEKVVLNLLSNAFKFTFNGEIAVSLRARGSAAELRVRDTGTGIPAEEMPRLFERFHRVQNARGRTHEGTGIGLALVQELVKLHGGSISANSEVGRGTTFTVTVPLGSAHLPPDQIGEGRSLTSNGSGASPFVEEALRWLPDDGQGEDEYRAELPTYQEPLPTPYRPPELDEADDRPRVLVADDNADMRQYVARILAEHFRVEAAPDGTAALAAAKAQPPDLVLTDVMMPRLDGFGLLRELRANPRTSTMPVILLSARAGEESRVEGMEAGADDYLIKPFSARELLARVSAHLQMARLRREAAQQEQRLRVEAEAAKGKLEGVLASISDQFLVLDRDWRYAYVNDRVTEATARSRQELLGRCVWVMFPETLGTTFERELRRAAAQQTPAHFEFHYPVWDRWFENHAYPSPDGVTLFVTEITDRKRAEGTIRALNDQLTADLESMTRLQELSTRMVGAGEFSRLLDEILNAALAVTACDRGNIQLLEGEALKIVSQRGFEAPFLDFFDAVHKGPGAACGTALQTGERVIIEDVMESPVFAGTPALEVLRAAQVRAVQSTPLVSRSGRMLGMFSTHYGLPHRPGARELRLLDLLARLAADLIENKQREETLRRQAALIRAVNDNTTELIFMKDLAGRLIYANAATLRVIGMTAEEALGSLDRDNFREPAEHGPTAANDRRVAETGQPLIAEEAYTCADGQRRVFLSNKSPLRDERGQIIGVIGVSRDITEHKRMQEQVRKNQQTFVDLVERAPFGIYIVDAQLRIAHMNAGSQTGAFANVRPVIGRDIAEAMRILWPEPVAAEIVGHFRHTLGTGEPYYSRQFVAPRGDIEAVESYEWELHRIELADGQYGVVCYYFDSTRLRQAEEALRDADRRKDEFLATLAHELRNPLAPVRYAVQALHMKGPATPELQWARDVIDRQMQQMTRLIDDLLDVSRISRGKLELKREHVELAKVVQSAVETSRPLIEQQGHHLTVTLPPAPVLLDGDVTRLAQVFANLLNNAAKYTERGGHIALTAERQGSDVVVSIKDTGIGIAADKLSGVFDMFSQVEGPLSRTQGGLGIGLSLVKRLVQMHGGSIEARSAGLGKGSELLVRLPVVLGQSRARSPDNDDGDTPTSRLRILIVDDNRDAADSLGMMLRIMGNEISTAYDGQQAMDRAGEIRPDVVLLDIGLPKLNGYDACRHIRQQPWGKSMVLIAVTGFGQEEDKRRAEEAGFDRHMVKPVNPQALMKMLAEMSDAARA